MCESALRAVLRLWVWRPTSHCFVQVCPPHKHYQIRLACLPGSSFGIWVGPHTDCRPQHWGFVLFGSLWN